MSKNRKSRWTEVSPTKHVTSCGEIRANPRGKWDAFVRYQKRIELTGSASYHMVVEPCGEWRRPREAMMAVEMKAKQLHRDGVNITLDDSIA